MNEGVFLTAKDLMILLGSQNYNSCANAHRAIRDAIAQGKRKLTIKEYCDFNKIDFEYIWNYLRSKPFARFPKVNCISPACPLSR